MLELNAVIFDMDGLMIDTEPVGKMLVKTSHEKFGYEITEEMFYHLIGTNEKTSKAYYHSVFGEDYPYQKIKDYRDQLRKEYFNSHPLEVKKGLYDLLEDLKKKNIKMDDGLFEALLIKSLKNPIELQQVLNALLSKQLDAENMCYLSSSFIHIISDDDIQWTLDGEDGGCCKDAYMQNMKEALSIICDRRALAKVSSKRAIE